MRFHGDVWNTSACEFCLCENGQVTCHTATCEPLFCELVNKKHSKECKLSFKVTSSQYSVLFFHRLCDFLH